MADCDAVSRNPLADAVDAAFNLVATAQARKPHAGVPRRVTSALRRLAEATVAAQIEEAQDLVWALWGDQADSAARDLMEAGTDAMVVEEFENAVSVFDRLVRLAPEWAEAWNKRATCRFVLGRDTEALRDIARTLELEPRHFGALSGFGQIALRNGFPNEAAVAFEAALTFNPHLGGVASVLAELKRQRAATLN